MRGTAVAACLLALGKQPVRGYNGLALGSPSGRFALFN
jgi:hypothetical protein